MRQCKVHVVGNEVQAGQAGDGQDLAHEAPRGLMVLSGGRFICGLGLSGPQVVEGWHGVAYGKPLIKTREYVEILRAIWKREKPLEFEGEHYQIGNMMLRNWLRSGQVQEPEPAVSNAIAEDMANEEQQALTTQITAWERRLGVLEVQQAQMGISTPPEVINEIADITTKLGKLKQELTRLRRR